MIELETLSTQIKQLVVDCLELDQDPSELNEDSTLIDDLGLDSAALLEVVAGIEEAFEIEIHTEEITEDRFRSINSLARFVATKT